MRPAAGREAGFALAESVAVLALSALVLLTLLIATDLVSRNSAAAARRANDLETLATGLAAVRRDLEGALIVRTSAGPESGALFVGSADSVGLAVESDRSGRDDGRSLIWVETRYEDGQGALIRSSARLMPGVSGFSDATFGASTVLALGPWRYEFSYAEETDGRLSWTGSMFGRVPVAIRLQVLSGDGARVVPPLTVRVNVNTAGCAELEGGCSGGPGG